MAILESLGSLVQLVFRETKAKAVPQEIEVVEASRDHQGLLDREDFLVPEAQGVKTGNQGILEHKAPKDLWERLVTRDCEASKEHMEDMEIQASMEMQDSRGKMA